MSRHLAKIMNARGKKLHHFVPRFYLRAWAINDSIYCLQDGAILRPNLKNVCAENYFYRLQPLSAEDMDFLRGVLVNSSPHGLKTIHEWMMSVLASPHVAKQRLEAAGRGNSSSMASVERLIIQLNEDMHTDIEDQFKPYLESLRKGDLTFLNEDQSAAGFYWTLMAQYMRTNHIKRLQYVTDPERSARYRRVANPLVHIIALNVGFSLFRDRERYTVMIVENTSATPFITTDQPIINMAANPTKGIEEMQSKFELYYPLSSTKAMLLLESGSAFRPLSPSLSELAAYQYNLRLAAHAHRQVLAATQAPLEEIRNGLPAYRSCIS
jgi:hypothetical protein